MSLYERIGGGASRLLKSFQSLQSEYLYEGFKDAFNGNVNGKSLLLVVIYTTSGFNK